MQQQCVCVCNAVDYQQTVFSKGSWVFVVSRSQTPAEGRLSIKSEYLPLFSIRPSSSLNSRCYLSFTRAASVSGPAGFNHLFAPIQLHLIIVLLYEITSTINSHKKAEDGDRVPIHLQLQGGILSKLFISTSSGITAVWLSKYIYIMLCWSIVKLPQCL